jgi:hypothetical protein
MRNYSAGLSDLANSAIDGCVRFEHTTQIKKTKRSLISALTKTKSKPGIIKQASQATSQVRGIASPKRKSGVA